MVKLSILSARRVIKCEITLSLKKKVKLGVFMLLLGCM